MQLALALCWIHSFACETSRDVGDCITRYDVGWLQAVAVTVAVAGVFVLCFWGAGLTLAGIGWHWLVDIY